MDEILWFSASAREFFLGVVGVGHIYFDVDPVWWAKSQFDVDVYLLNWVVA